MAGVVASFLWCLCYFFPSCGSPTELNPAVDGLRRLGGHHCGTGCGREWTVSGDRKGSCGAVDSFTNTNLNANIPKLIDLRRK